MTIVLSASQERVIRDAIRQGRFGSVEQALDAAVSSLEARAVPCARLTPAEAANRILTLRKGNVLPDGMSIRGMTEEGRA